MKSLIFWLTLSLQLEATAQSPGLTINVIMDSVKAESTRYKIEMKICKPKKMTQRGNWFSRDTSTIDFASLKANDIDCGEYFDKGMPTLISGPDEKPPFNQFEFSGQVFAWEEIYVFKISDRSSGGWNPEMYIVIPIKYKSFRTSINLTDIEFLSGKVIFLADIAGKYDESKLFLSKSVKNEKGIDVKVFRQKELLEPKAKPLSMQGARILPFQQDEKWGLAERGNLKIKLAPVYAAMKPLGEGYFEVLDSTGNYLIIDSTAREVLRLPDDIVIHTNNGLFRYGNKGENEWYHISGRKLRIDTAEVESAGNCYEGRLMYFGKNGKEGFLDTEGKVAVKAVYDKVYAFSREYGTVITGNKWGAVDKQGKIIIPLRYDGVMSLGDGFFAVYKNKKVALADKSGKILTGFDFDYIHEFYDGLAWVKKGKQTWYINNKGQNAFKRVFTKASSFENGIAIVNDGKNDLLIDRKGIVQYKAPVHYNIKGAMEGYFFEVEDKNTETFLIINPSGKILFDGMNDLPHETNNKWTVVKKNDKYGIINMSGVLVLPPDYDQVAYIKEVDAWYVAGSSGKGFIDEKGNKYWK